MITRLSCTFVFILFTFYYLYNYQADLLTVVQHVLSKGQTHYNHFIGAVIISAVLLLLQISVLKIFGRMRQAWALTFVPSALCLIALTDVDLSPVNNDLHFGNWIFLSPIMMVVFGVVLWILEKYKLLDSFSRPIRQIWTNLAIMVAILLFVCMATNSDKVYHARIHAEQCLLDGDIDGALNVCGRFGGADKNLTMLTAFALSKKNQLAEKLFEYPVTGNSDCLLPNGRSVKFEIFPERNFYEHLGGYYIQRMSSARYIDFQMRHRRMNKHMIDYMLCAQLLDRNLDDFVVNLQKYYEVNDSVTLPRYYREALTLYTHLHSNPIIVYNDNVLNVDYQDYQKIIKSSGDPRAVKTSLRDTYGNTYWFYYDNR